MGNVIYYKQPGELIRERFYQWLDGGDFLQPSCFFRRSAWDAAGPLDESLQIALDVDLWLRMAGKVTFQRVDQLLSTSLAHGRAKTTAFRNHMIIECATVIIKAGGEKFVRDRLSDMAAQLAFYEANFNKIMHHRLTKLIRPLVRLFIKPAVRWPDVLPRW